MSILVRGMEMPENCGPCPFSKLSMDCRLTGKTVHLDWLKRKRPDWCPLGEVKTPHGRLIDEEAVIDHFVSLSNYEWNQNVSTSWANAFAEAASDICDIPTIIEAEGA